MIYRFVILLSVASALVIAGAFTLLKGIHKKNEDIFNKKNILASVEKVIKQDYEKSVAELSSTEVEDIFEKNITQFVIDAAGEDLTESAGVAASEVDMARERKLATPERKWPLFVYQANTGKKYYILSVRGNGLWDEIWGNISLEEDFNIIAGAVFDHKGETPGLGAEIKDNAGFSQQFEGKRIYNENGQYVSVTVQKGGARDAYKDYEVDGISGATVTADGVTDMLYEGIRQYEPFFDKLRNK